MLLSSKTLYLAGTRNLLPRFVGPFEGVLERVGKTAYRLDLRGDSKMFTMSFISPSFASTPLEAHLQTHPSQSKWKAKNTSKLRPCYSIEAETALVSIL